MQTIQAKHKQLKASVQFKVRPNTSDQKAIAQVYEIQSYRRKKFFVEPGEKWLDLGANVGAFSVYAAQYGNPVIAYEAESTNFEITKNNFELNLVAGAVKHAAIVPDNYGPDEITLNVHTNNRPMALRRHSIYKPKKDFVQVIVPAIKFGDLRKTGHDCIKMNIEGVEIEIVKQCQDFSWIKKMVFEWSFDKEPNVDVLRDALAKLRTHFSYVDINRTLADNLKKWTFYPPNAFIYCIR